MKVLSVILALLALGAQGAIVMAEEEICRCFNLRNGCGNVTFSRETNDCFKECPHWELGNAREEDINFPCSAEQEDLSIPTGLPEFVIQQFLTEASLDEKKVCVWSFVEKFTIICIGH